MRLERLDNNKIKVFLTHDDLLDRGLTKEDLWDNTLKVRELFRDMMDEATVQLGFEASGSLAVEVFALKAQGMVVIVTKGETESEEDDFLDDFLEMQVTLDESEDVFFVFDTFEDVIQLCKRLMSYAHIQGQLFSYNGRFYLLFEDLEDINIEIFVALLAEYGAPATLTKYRVGEYGKVLMQNDVISEVNRFFSK